MSEHSGDKWLGRIEDDPIAQQLPQRPTFIPLRHYDLKRVTAEHFQLDGVASQEFSDLCDQLHSFFHVEHQKVLLKLEELYERLDPDSQAIEVEPVDERHRRELGNWLIDNVSNLLHAAHYKRLSREELERAIEVGWQWGVRLEVNFDLFDHLEIFARGYQTVTISRRRWQNFFRRESIELPEFTRLILAFRVKPDDQEGAKGKSAGKGVSQMLDSRYVYLKTFKNIPETDLEILLPGSKVRLTKFDRAKILFPTVSGMAITGYKLARSAIILGLAFSWKTWFGFAVLVGGAIGYVVKSVLSYFRTRNNYQFGLTKSLYLKNLDNNLSVLYRILNEAEEQEISEAILAYAFLWQSPEVAETGIGASELDLLVETFLRQTTALDVDFEVHDALAKLARLGLAQVDRDGLWTVVEPALAKHSLGQHWNRLLDSSVKDLPDDSSTPQGD